MDIYSLIPARSGSKSVPNKNIKMLANLPVLAYSINDSLNCPEIIETYVTTDSGDYVDLATSYGAKVITRPDFCCTDTAVDLDYLLHFIYTQELDINDGIVLLRPTTPLREVSVLSKAINYFLDNKYKCSSMRSVHVLSEPPEKMCKPVRIGERFSNVHIEPYMGGDHEGANKPKELYDVCYVPNGYIDIVTVKTIIDTKTTYGNMVYKFVTEKAVEIDSQEEFDYLEYLVSKR